MSGSIMVHSLSKRGAPRGLNRAAFSITAKEHRDVGQGRAFTFFSLLRASSRAAKASESLNRACCRFMTLWYAELGGFLGSNPNSGAGPFSAPGKE